MTVLADFVVGIEGWPETQPVDRDVRVVVYDNVKGLRTAASRYSNQNKNHRRRIYGDYANTLGVCHRFEWLNADDKSMALCAIVRLAEPNLGVGIVSHEMTHAAVWIRELAVGHEPLTCENDEEFAWLIGELVHQAINGMTERGVYRPTDTLQTA